VASIYRVEARPWGCRQVSYDDEARVRERSARWLRTVGDVEADLTGVTARTGMDGGRQATSCSVGPVAEDVDHVVVYRAPASQWGCLRGC
jgi:uncharacterized protein (DUF934 family)